MAARLSECREGPKQSGLSLTATDGVALAAIQGLYTELKELQRTVEEQSRRLEEQRKRIRDLERSQESPGDR